MLHIEIDGKKLVVEEGAMVIEAAEAAGIYIPRFCYHKKLSVAANCRMCLVEVERVAKPVPACATPVTEGMRVFTQSAKTADAQKGVMEFLLINHPLDCPVCDQGGECELQDLAVGYGRDVSRFQEAKRIVADKDIGPLISTEMTRCIHCTRCVRFGQEIGGIMELGATGRGEHMRIGTYVEAGVDSELSGNMIDLCPVGALTSKPYRYTARPWELINKPSVSPHDCVGTNLDVQVRRNKVMRILPRENEAINEVWLADRDRFSYVALHGGERLKAPLVRDGGVWREVDWEIALDRATEGLRGAIGRHGPAAFAALASAQLTVEEGFLLQRLVRGLGSDNIDHRLRELDFRDDTRAPLFPGLGQAIQDLERVDAALLIGSNVRKEQPLLGHRLRKAFLEGARIAAINPLDFPFVFDLAAKAIVTPAAMVETTARVAWAVARRMRIELPAELRALTDVGAPGTAEEAIAEVLCGGRRRAVLLGALASTHPQAAELRGLARFIAQVIQAPCGELPCGNGAGAWLAGVLPHRGPMGRSRATSGRPAAEMFDGSQKAFLLADVEPVLDSRHGERARKAMEAADCVVALSIFRGEALDYADVVLPWAPYTETDGTFVNAEGRFQSFRAAIPPVAEARPGWKILRVLAERLGVDGCSLDSAAAILQELRSIQRTEPAPVAPWTFVPPARPASVLERVATVSLYDSDTIVRRAEPLQRTADRPRPAAYFPPADLAERGLAPGSMLVVTMGTTTVRLEAAADDRVPAGAVFIPAALPETAALPLSGEVTVGAV
ncbi:MAG: NADH-quinone oxidoreductase subunit NuoG [Gammaproteobacteria bacterium]|nr:NADH-quinone oxidoreductase subunit NuoG [Gammaproteobacteria bacterium]